MVKVPVLSHRMIEVAPIVSTDSRFFTTQFLLFRREAETLRAMVTTAIKPSGTFATIKRRKEFSLMRKKSTRCHCMSKTLF